MNNRERQMWIDNDETLYIWWRSSGLGKFAFIKKYRVQIDEIINRVLGR